MFVRLGFAIAAHLDADVMLIDEVLAVGDEAFQRKCLDRVRELMGGGMTLVLVSHDAGAIEAVCERVVVLDEGRVAFDGPTAEGWPSTGGCCPTARERRCADDPARGRAGAARAEVQRLKALGRYGEEAGDLRIEPLDQVTNAQLLEWALIEPDLSKLRSTRRGGAPITWVKRQLLRGLQQYHNEVTYQQTRFNIHVLRKLLELEDRIEAAERRDDP